MKKSPQKKSRACPDCEKSKTTISKTRSKNRLLLKENKGLTVAIQRGKKELQTESKGFKAQRNELEATLRAKDEELKVALRKQKNELETVFKNQTDQLQVALRDKDEELEEGEQILKVVPDPLIVKAVSDAIRFLKSDPVHAVREIGETGVRKLIMYLERKNQIEPAENWLRRTRGLSERNLISQIVGYEMDAVREIRNKVVNEGASVTRLDAEGSVRMFVAVLDNVFGVKA
jgi:hypothetical protein